MGQRGRSGLTTKTLLKTLIGLTLLLLVVTVVTGFGTVSPMDLFQPTAVQTALASMMYSDPRAIYLASLGINTTFFQTPLFWIYRYVTTGITDGKLIEYANLVQYLANIGVI